ncbi:unnamed protein product [Arctogadus glacialis]
MEKDEQQNQPIAAERVKVEPLDEEKASRTVCTSRARPGFQASLSGVGSDSFGRYGPFSHIMADSVPERSLMRRTSHEGSAIKDGANLPLRTSKDPIDLLSRLGMIRINFRKKHWALFNLPRYLFS